MCFPQRHLGMRSHGTANLTLQCTEASWSAAFKAVEMDTWKGKEAGWKVLVGQSRGRWGSKPDRRDHACRGALRRERCAVVFS